MYIAGSSVDHTVLCNAWSGFRDIDCQMMYARVSDHADSWNTILYVSLTATVQKSIYLSRLSRPFQDRIWFTVHHYKDPLLTTALPKPRGYSRMGKGICSMHW